MIKIKEAEHLAAIAVRITLRYNKKDFETKGTYVETIIEAGQKCGLIELDAKQQVLEKMNEILTRDETHTHGWELAKRISKYFEEEEDG
jgi:hypothetical protein